MALLEIASSPIRPKKFNLTPLMLKFSTQTRRVQAESFDLNLDRTRIL